VYIGNGVPWSETYNEDHRKKFMEENELFPPFFGYPNCVRKDQEKLWFPDFMRAYYEFYNTKFIDSLKIEKESGTEFLIKELENHTPQHKLLVVCVAPMHDLINIPTELYKNMNLFVMGGGFEEDIETFLRSGRSNLNVS